MTRIACLVFVCLMIFARGSSAGETAGIPPEVIAPNMTFVSPKHNDLILELIQKHRFDVSSLVPLFQNAVILPEILEKFARAPEKRLAYYEYRALFFKGDLIAIGRSYMKENQSLLENVEAQYGVPKEIIAAILGIETRFGQPGIEKYRAWDILNTAYALHPTRADFYKGELIAFLRLCREEGHDPLSIKSSYAGAVGVPQFIPTSVLKYAVDYDGNQKRDLWSSKGDIYASVANYLKEMGWKRGGPLWLPVQIPEQTPDIQKRLEAGIKETLLAARAAEMGITMPPSVGPTELLSLTAYKPQENMEQVLALFDNFRVLTRYNISINYALAVTELAEALAAPKETPVLPISEPANQQKPVAESQNGAGASLAPPPPSPPPDAPPSPASSSPSLPP